MRRFPHWYGAGPLHLLTLIGSFALAGYAAAGLLPHHVIGIAVWFAGAVIGHDLVLMPLYTIADRSAQAVFRHRLPEPPAVPWINYLRVPVALSGLLLLIWFPLIFRLPKRFPVTTTLPLDPYLWHWLAVTGALFLLSATALALRMGAAGRRSGQEHTAGGEVPVLPAGAGHSPPAAAGPAGADKAPPADDAETMPGTAREPGGQVASGPPGPSAEPG